MFAVIRTGGKQYRVAQDDVLTVAKLGGDAPQSGAPLISGALVEAEIVEHGRGPKVIAFKKKRRKNTHRKRGSRSHFTKLKITSISAG